MIVFAKGRPRGASPSQSYAPVSTTTLFSAVAALSPRCRAASRLRPAGRAMHFQQHLVGVETQPPLGVEGPGDAVGVDLACGYAGDKDVPIMVGPVDPWMEIDDPSRLWGVNVVEQHQLRSCAVLGENAKIAAAGYERCSQRGAFASFANQVLHRLRC